MRVVPGGTSVAQQVVVSRPVGTVSGLAVTSASLAGPALTTGRPVPSQPLVALPSRVETLSRAYRQGGFSAEVSQRLASTVRESSLAAYQGKWAVFLAWCGERGVDPLSATVPVIADFFLYLFSVRKLAPHTIAAYRSALAGVFRPILHLDLGTDHQLGALLKSFYIERPRSAVQFPKWNLALVLRSLTKGPYEPLATASLKFLTLKTVFLLAFASAARRSELHAWDASSLKHAPDWSSVWISTIPGFLAKNQSSSEGARSFQIRALSTFVSPDMTEDRSLCPVRALKRYLATVKPSRGQRRRLFLSFKPGFTKEICANTISAWLKKVILLAYETADEEDQTLLGVRAHEVRALSASWASYAGASISTILEACHWRAHSTFTSFYLRDLSAVADDLYSLGPLVAAQQRV